MLRRHFSSFSSSNNIHTAAAAAASTTFRCDARRFFYFTHDSPLLKSVSDKLKFSSPIWVEDSDLAYVSRSLCPLKKTNNSTNSPPTGFQVKLLPQRLVLFNVGLQCDVAENPAWAEKVRTPTESDQHVNFISGREFPTNQQFQLEQRAFTLAADEQAAAAAADDQANSSSNSADADADKKKKKQQQQQERALYSKNYWITPRDAATHRMPVLPKHAFTPFALLSKSKKERTVYNASQFVDPARIETLPIHFHSARIEGIESFQRDALRDWHEAHLSMVRAEEGKSSSSSSAPGGKAGVGSSSSSAIPLSDRLSIWATESQYKEMNIKLRPTAEGVTVLRYYSDAKGRAMGAAVGVTSKADSAADDGSGDMSNKTKKDPAVPHDNDVFFFADVVNDVWKNSHLAKPDFDKDVASPPAAASSINDRSSERTVHLLLPGGIRRTFASMQASLDERLAEIASAGSDDKSKVAARCIKNKMAFWVTRGVVKKQGLQLVEGAKALSVHAKTDAQKKLEEEFATSSGKNATVTFYHISQVEGAEVVILQTGKHSR